jgi:hypothetical protein
MIAIAAFILLVQETPEAVVAKAVDALVKAHEPDGQWAYEGVYRFQGEIPVGYRVGGTSIVATALLCAAPDARPCVARGLDFVLKALDDPLMQPSTEEAYDVRVWGQACALEFLCHLKAAGWPSKEIEARAPRLVRILLDEVIRDGGWNYAWRRQGASFVTAPVVQSLLRARASGFEVPDEVFKGALNFLDAARVESGAFAYSGRGVEGPDPRNLVPGSIARSPLCEATRILLGGGSAATLKPSLDAFHEHWSELEARRKKTGTHEGRYGIAPYYFYFGHRYAAQAIELLPEGARPRERERLLAAILRTRDEDGTWNDRVFPRSKAYSTAMVVLALLGPKIPAPPALRK